MKNNIFIGIEVVDEDLDQEVVDVEDQKVVIDVVGLEVMIGGGLEEVKIEIDIEEMIGVIMIVGMIIVPAVAQREETEGQIEETVQIEGKLGKERVLLGRILN